MIRLCHIYIKLLVIMGFSIIATALCAEEEKKISLLLPVNSTKEEGSRIQLALHSPQNFRCIQEKELLENPTGVKIIEFIPMAEEENNWSEIITVTKYIGEFVNAKILIEHLRNAFILAGEGASDINVLENDTTQEESFETANISIAYTLKGHREIVRIKAFSGPIDCVCTQYAIKLQTGKTETDALKKIRLWMENKQNVRIIKF